MKVVYEDWTKEVNVQSPYIPGFLAFKEVPSYEPLFKRLPKEFTPQVLLVDGNGILHTREFGCACHIGVQFGLPTIGVAKKTFDVDGLVRSYVEDLCEQNLHKQHDSVELIGNSGKCWGYGLRCGNSKMPVFVSQGHRVSGETALAIVKLVGGNNKIPEPIRQADLRGRELVREHFDNGLQKQEEHANELAQVCADPLVIEMLKKMNYFK